MEYLKKYISYYRTILEQYIGKYKGKIKLRIPREDRMSPNIDQKNPKITNILFDIKSDGLILKYNHETRKKDVLEKFKNLKYTPIFEEYITAAKQDIPDPFRNIFLVFPSLNQTFTNAFDYLITKFVQEVYNGEISYSDAKPSLPQESQESQAPPALPQAQS